MTKKVFLITLLVTIIWFLACWYEGKKFLEMNDENKWLRKELAARS